MVSSITKWLFRMLLPLMELDQTEALANTAEVCFLGAVCRNVLLNYKNLHSAIQQQLWKRLVRLQHLLFLNHFADISTSSNDVLTLEIDAGGTQFSATNGSRQAFATLIDGDQWMIYQNTLTGVLHWDFVSVVLRLLPPASHFVPIPLPRVLWAVSSVSPLRIASEIDLYRYCIQCV
jgi:hypothetical protein